MTSSLAVSTWGPITFFKKFARSVIPERYRKTWRTWKASTAVAMVVRAGPLIPLYRLFEVKRAFERINRLDYLQEEIFLVANSEVEVGRAYACAKEPETVKWIETFVRPGEVMYDVGANVGAYSFIAYKVAKGDIKIFAFEPGYMTFPSLVQNIGLNKAQDNICALPVALSNETGIVVLNYSSLDSGSASHLLGSTTEEVAARETIPPVFKQPVLTYCLDELVKQFALPIPNHIKIDVDGTEYCVLDGAREILASSQLRTVLVEVDENEQKANQISALLEQNRFSLLSKYQHAGGTIYNYIFTRLGDAFQI